ncbi:hypothetical protein IAG41_12510 [Sphingomonas sp. JC676]|uniref:hypothetical protein n=1 Tax=Sphingomonas sp. JC676 TaxID=2768065 RepID=UPI0016579119|nr:hypothetical protein [Sphingomonas sp. JC676]MBC9033213.1 hypothetical protein [Sphingomonas sp. JC676]
MLPRNPSKIFRSRWSALFWAAGVLVTAVTTIGFGSAKTDAKPGAESALTDDSGAEVSNADLAVLRNYLAN